MKALIAAGGRATRLRPITWTINKHLIPLANKPMIFNAIEKIVEAGVTEIAININPGETEIQKVVGDGSLFGAKMSGRSVMARRPRGRAPSSDGRRRRREPRRW